MGLEKSAEAIVVTAVTKGRILCCREQTPVLAENRIRRRNGESARVALLGYRLRTADRQTDEQFRPGHRESHRGSLPLRSICG